MISDVIERAQNYVAPTFSPILHFTLFSLRRQAVRFESGMFITSIDVDVGNERLGVINQGKCDRDVSEYDSERFVGEVEQRNLPLLLNLFEDFEIPMTFAFRGQLFDVDASFPKLVKRSSIGHEIGSHGYYHRSFTNLSQEEANEELKMTSIAMKKYGVIPKSFVFPRNRIAYRDLLKKHGYVCYRGLGGFVRDGSYIRRDCHGLYDIHPSFFIGSLARASEIRDSSFTKRIVDICAKRKLPFHVWFHPRDIGETEEQAKRRIERTLSPLLRHAKTKERVGALTFETMLSASNRAKACCTSNETGRIG